MLPDADADLQQLAIPTTVLRFKSLTNLDYHVHGAVAADMLHTHDHLQQLSLKLSVTKLESSHASYDELDCCWKIRNPNHQPKIMK